MFNYYGKCVDSTTFTIWRIMRRPVMRCLPAQALAKYLTLMPLTRRLIYEHLYVCCAFVSPAFANASHASAFVSRYVEACSIRRLNTASAFLMSPATR